MKIDLSPINYKFETKPLLVGGMAMEYYNLRKSGADIDLIVTENDYLKLASVYPNNLRDLYGDLGVMVEKFEIWKCILLFHYEFLSKNAIELDNVKVISLEKLLFLKTLAISEPKYEKDVRMIVKKIHDIQYGKDKEFNADYFRKI